MMTYVRKLMGLALFLSVSLAACARPPSQAGQVTTIVATATLSAPARTEISIPPTATVEPLTPSSATTPVIGYRVVASYPHDPQAFTQGLLFHDGFLYEGTGLIGQSTLRRVDLQTGEVVQQRDLPPDVFGEGIARVDERIIQLTWQSHIGYVYDRATFELLDTFTYPTEGWGITYDGMNLIMSDGTATLYLLDPATFERRGEITVRDGTEPVERLNELEYIDGEIYANIWQTDRIARIDPQTGNVLSWIDLSGLLAKDEYQGPVDVLNGIAYDSENDRLFVTGKLWPRLYEIELDPPRQ